MESSVLSEVDDTSILRTGLPTPLCLSSQLATGLSPRAPRSGLEPSDFVHWHQASLPRLAPSVTTSAHTAFPELRADRLYHQARHGHAPRYGPVPVIPRGGSLCFLPPAKRALRSVAAGDTVAKQSLMLGADNARDRDD